MRADMRKVLSNLDERWLTAASSALCSNLTKLFKEQEESKGEKAILAWTSFFPGEPDLTGFIATHLSNYDIYLPKTYKDYSMKYLSVSSGWDAESSPGDFGIPEPIAGSFFEPDKYDDFYVLVPGLAFDRLGNRIGRGKGYYDRFLSQSEIRDATTIGICWSLQIVQEIRSESHDVPVDWLCTEESAEWAAPDVIGELNNDAS